jgi:ketopantoate hydroxymethyltransferase
MYIDLSQTIIAALTDFRQEVEGGAFPTPQHSYTIDDNELQKLMTQLNS